jgi:hypothetical protein
MFTENGKFPYIGHRISCINFYSRLDDASQLQSKHVAVNKIDEN